MKSNIIMVYDKVWSFPFFTPLRPNSICPTPLNIDEEIGKHEGERLYKCYGSVKYGNKL